MDYETTTRFFTKEKILKFQTENGTEPIWKQPRFENNHEIKIKLTGGLLRIHMTTVVKPNPSN